MIVWPWTLVDNLYILTSRVREYAKQEQINTGCRFNVVLNFSFEHNSWVKSNGAMIEPSEIRWAEGFPALNDLLVYYYYSEFPTQPVHCETLAKI